MSKCNRCHRPKCDCTCGSCKPTSCKQYTSGLTYDGIDMPWICVKHGDPLNKVLEKIGRGISDLYGRTEDFKSEAFIGHENIKLSSTPSEILQVTYCGGILPKDGYTFNGMVVVLDDKYCKSGDDVEIQVFYRSKYTNNFNTNCDV